MDMNIFSNYLNKEKNYALDMVWFAFYRFEKRGQA
jgi:hypothetical protein